MDDSSEISEQPEMQPVMLSEDRTLKYDFMFSLQKIAMSCIATRLWMNQISQVSKIEWFELEDTWHEIEDTVVGKVSQLFLPNGIGEQLQNLVVIFGESIFEYIDFHNSYVFRRSDLKYYAKYLARHIIWTVRGRIDYGQTAKKIIASQGLHDDLKYKLACMNCLEDEIRALAPKINVNDFLSSGILIDEHPMVYFWTAHFRDDTQLNNLRYYDDRNQRDVHMSINEYIMVRLINDGSVFNDIPIKYMWDKLNVEEKAKCIKLLIRNRITIRHQDFIFSLLSNIEYEQQQKVFQDYSKEVLCGILDNWWWWGEYFLPTVYHTLNSIDPMSYWEVLRYMYLLNIYLKEEKKCMFNQFKCLFKRLWRESSPQFKDIIFQSSENEIERFLIQSLNWEEDIDICELMLNDYSIQSKKITLSNSFGVQICANLIKNDNWDLLEVFLKDAFSSEEGIDELKEKLIKDKGKDIALHFLKTDAYDVLKRFIDWSFKSKELIWKLFSTD